MIVHLFNSSIVSGPERLVLPALTKFTGGVEIWFLIESRIVLDSNKNPVLYAKKLGFKVRTIEVESRLDSHCIKTLGEFLYEFRPRLVHAHDVKASVYLGLAHFYLRFFATSKMKWIYRANIPK
jgi:hypothetical protein